MTDLSRSAFKSGVKRKSPCSSLSSALSFGAAGAFGFFWFVMAGSRTESLKCRAAFD